mgnify:FL=1
MFQQPLMMMPEEQELTIDQKLKKFKEKRVKDELDRALRRTSKVKKDDSKNLFSMLQTQSITDTGVM